MTGPRGRNQDRPFAVQRLLEQMRFHGVRRRRAPDEAYRRRGPSVRPGQALRPWLRLFPDRLFEGPPHRSAQEERQGRIRGHLVGSGLQRDRREGEGHHRRQGAAGACMVQDPRPSGKYYTKRFMNALGSANVYTHGAACNLSKESGFTQPSARPAMRPTWRTPR